MNFIMAYLVQVKSDKYQVVVKNFLGQLGEWSRMKHAMRKFFNGIILLQRTCRGFIALKRQRCHSIMAAWVHTEDHHLVDFYKMYAEIIVEEANKKASEHKKHAVKV